MNKYRIFIIGLLFSSLIFIYFYGGKIPYMLFYMSILLPMGSLAYALLIYIRFKYSHKIDKLCVIKGEKITLDIQIHNESIFFFPYIKVNFLNSNKIFNNQLAEESFSLKPKTHKSNSYELDCKYRGAYSVGIDKIVIEDFTGAFKLKYNPGNFYNITVSPQIIHLDKFFIKTSFMSESHSNLSTYFKDFNTISHLREYAYGDISRYIHWKTSAKLDRLMVKNFQSTSGVNAVLILDTFKNKFEADENIILEDKLIEALIAVLYYLLSNFINTRIIFYQNGVQDIELKTMPDFENMYDYMSTIYFNSTVDMSDLLKIYLSETLNRNNILLFSCNMNYNLYEQLLNAKMTGHEPSLIYVSPQDLVSEKDPDEDIILSSLSEQNISIYKININDDIKQVLEKSC